jgi:uroporphyrinogen-III synthase
MENKIVRILSTRPVEESLIEKAAGKGIAVDVLSFIDTVPLEDMNVVGKISQYAQQNCIIIFTSMNAVDSVIHQLNNAKPVWKIFCMGNTTKQLVKDFFGDDHIIATASSATALAGEITNWKKSENDDLPVIFFCGDQRRDELPGKLRQEGIAIEEIITYKTIETTHQVTAAYSGILFFSPSAVHSFFKTNKSGTGTVLFAIGETTANTISMYSNNKIVIGDTPAKDELLKKAIDWLSAD